MSTMRSAHAAGHTLGYANYDKPEVMLSLYGPRGGNAGLHCLAPDEARKLAASLLKAADQVESRSRDELIEEGLRFAENPLGYNSCNDAQNYPYDFANGYADEMLGLEQPDDPTMTIARGGAYALGRYEAKERLA